MYSSLIQSSCSILLVSILSKKSQALFRFHQIILLANVIDYKQFC